VCDSCDNNATTTSCDSVCLGLAIGLVLAFVVVVAVVVVVVVVVRKRRRQATDRRSQGPHVSNVVVAPTPSGEYAYINPVAYNRTESLPPPDSIRLPETNDPKPTNALDFDSQYLTVNQVNAAKEKEHYV